MKRDRSLSPLGNGDDDEDNDQQELDNERRFERKKSRPMSKKVPSSRRVYVLNIPYEHKWQDLKDLFRAEVGDVAYVEMFNDDRGRPRGCAIVDFETPEMARKAIEKMHRFEVKGRQLLVKERDEISRSREFMFMFESDKQSDRDRGRFSRDIDRGRSYDRTPAPDMMGPAKFGNTYGLSISFLESLGINGPLVNKVFVANLDYKVTEDDLKEVFKVAGKVTQAEVTKDPDGKSRGFGVVEFEHPVQAIQAISMLHNQVYYDRKISVRLDRAAEKQKEVNRGNSKLPPGLKGLGMGLGVNGVAIIDAGNMGTNSPSTSSAMSNAPVMGGMMNMPSNMLDPGNSGHPMNNPVSMMGMSGIDPPNNPMPGGMGGVNPNIGSSVGMGIGGQNMVGMSAALNQSLGSGLAPNAFSNQATGLALNAVAAAAAAAAGPNAGMGFSFNNNSRDYSSSSSNYGLRSVVQISNLPLDYTWQSLRDLCRDYGEIRFAEIRSKGIGLVRFSSETGARRAADMLDRQRFDGRVLDARIL